MKQIIILAFLVLTSHFTASASTAEMNILFARTYESNYIARRCYENTVRLLKSAEKEKINIYNANIIHITNKGFSALGLVNAEFARSKSSPSETNWQFHAVLEMDGMIYDYDFATSPIVLPVKQYFEKMFLIERPKNSYGTFFVGRETKLKDYEISILPGLEVLRSTESRGPAPKGETLRLRSFLNRF